MSNEEVNEICKAYVYNVPKEQIMEASGMTSEEFDEFIRNYKSTIEKLQNHFVNVIQNKEE